MCQVSAYIKSDEQQELVKENVTRLEMLKNGLRISTLFEGAVDLEDMVVDHIDFTNGRLILEKTG
ncbi:MAG: CooT family nickel-binding protein [Desulfopila sp.]